MKFRNLRLMSTCLSLFIMMWSVQAANVTIISDPGYAMAVFAAGDITKACAQEHHRFQRELQS